MIAGMPGIGIGMFFYVMLVPLMALVALRRVALGERNAAACFEALLRAVAIVLLIALGFWLQVELVQGIVGALTYVSDPDVAENAQATVRDLVVIVPFVPVLILALLIAALQISRAILLWPSRST